MSFFLVFLAIVLIGATVWAGAGGMSGVLRRRRPGRPLNEEMPDRGLLDGGFEQPVANLPPVLLPAEAVPADVDRIRFSLGLRGYRMDQVDQVLDELRDQLAAKHEEVERLRAALDAEQGQRASGIPGPGLQDTGNLGPGLQDTGNLGPGLQNAGPGPDEAEPPIRGGAEDGT